MNAPWHRAAACKDMDPDIFEPDGHDNNAIADAKAICQACPVRPACLDAALDEEGGSTAQSRSGIRGGLTPSARVNRNKYRQSVARKAAKAAT